MTECYVANLAAVAHEAFEEETVLINFERGTYFSLRESASAIWTMIQTPAVADDLLAALAALYGPLPDDAPGAVTALLERLCDEGCALHADTASATAPGPALAAAGGFALPVMEAFHDLEDLISIDPVHETHEFTGWPNRPPSYAIED
jgi:hypothetical protein